MKLFYSATSPFVRKVVVLAKETGLEARLELIPTTVSPVNQVEALNSENPLGKVPCLITDEGMAIYDSRVICEYLDGQHDGPKMIPTEGAARWRNLRILALCDDIQEATILTLYERRLRPAEKVSEDWIEAQMAKVHRALAALAEEMAGADQSLNMAAISAAVALGYMDFRLADIGWRETSPELANWYAEFSQRPSIADTVPVDP